MSHYDLPQLLKKWEIAALTPEQTIGQILLNLRALSNRVGKVEGELMRLRRGESQAVSEEERPDAETAESVTTSEQLDVDRADPVPAEDPLAVNVAVTIKRLIVNFHDGRALYVPIDWYPRLVHATPAERQACELLENGSILSWPKLEETIGVEALLNGQRSGESAEAFEKWLAARVS